MFCHGGRWNAWGSWPDDEQVREPAPAGVGRDPDVRVSQAERDEVVTVLGRHYADGRLSEDEYEERAGDALAARTGRDLDALLTDLPTLPAVPAAEAPRAAVRWRQLRPYLPRVLAVTAVVVLAMGSGLWVLWLLWPALALTPVDRHRHGSHRPRPHRPSRAHYGGRPVTDRL